MTRSDSLDASSSNQNELPQDPRETLLTPQQLGNHRGLARAIYAHLAQSICSPEACDAVCKRRGRCAYLQPDPLPCNAPAYLVGNLRHRNMPLCLAMLMDDDAYEELRALVTVALV